MWVAIGLAAAGVAAIIVDIVWLSRVLGNHAVRNESYVLAGLAVLGLLLQAAMLRRHGYGALPFDLRAHGESEGDTSTLGYAEVDPTFDIEGVDVAEEDVGVGAGVEEDGLLHPLNEAGETPVGLGGRYCGGVVVEDGDRDRAVRRFGGGGEGSGCEDHAHDGFDQLHYECLLNSHNS